jgi:hypothetical protein
LPCSRNISRKSPSNPNAAQQTDAQLLLEDRFPPRLDTQSGEPRLSTTALASAPAGQMRIRITNQLQAVVFMKGVRRKKALWSKEGPCAIRVFFVVTMGHTTSTRATGTPGSIEADHRGSEYCDSGRSGMPVRGAAPHESYFDSLTKGSRALQQTRKNCRSSGPVTRLHHKNKRVGFGVDRGPRRQEWQGTVTLAEEPRHRVTNNLPTNRENPLAKRNSAEYDSRALRCSERRGCRL